MVVHTYNLSSWDSAGRKIKYARLAWTTQWNSTLTQETNQKIPKLQNLSMQQNQTMYLKTESLHRINLRPK